MKRDASGEKRKRADQVRRIQPIQNRPDRGGILKAKRSRDLKQDASEVEFERSAERVLNPEARPEPDDQVNYDRKNQVKRLRRNKEKTGVKVVH